jgi:anti-sigma factor RsiW
MIMECQRCRENLTAYLDGELSGGESAEIKSHLDACTSCKDELSSLQKAADLIGSHIIELEPGLGSWARVQAKISDKRARSPFGFLALNRWRFAFAALVFMGTIALSYLWHQQVQQRSLDEYISQYVKTREAGEHIRRLIGKARPGILDENFSADNPFIEVKATMDINPFRSEDR